MSATPASTPARRVKMSDVARLAGVAQSTVSYVLRGTRPISQETKDAVHRAIEELQYTPHAGAQLLRGSPSHTLALSAPGADSRHDAVVGVFFLEITAAARRRGYDLLITSAADESSPSLVESLKAGRADAAILMLAPVRDDPRIQALHDAALPAVVLGMPDPDIGVPYVDHDLAAGASMAVHRLADLGHRSIVYVGWTDEEEESELLYATRTRDGIAAAATERNVRIVRTHSSRDPDVLTNRLVAALSRPSHPTAMICRHLSGFEQARRIFHHTRPEADLAKSIIALGTLGRYDSPGEDTTRVEQSVRDLTDRLVDTAIRQAEGHPVVSQLLAPVLRIA